MNKAIKETAMKVLFGLILLAGLSVPAYSGEKPKGVVCENGVCKIATKELGKPSEKKDSLLSVLNSEKAVIVFYEENSLTKKYVSDFNSLMSNYPGIKILNVKDFGSKRELSKLNLPKSFPVNVFYKNGKEVGRFVGMGNMQEIESRLANHFKVKNLKISGKTGGTFKNNYTNLKEIVNNDFSYIENADKAVADFYADWCAPCKTYAPIFEEVLEKYPDVKCARVNIEKNKEIFKKYGGKSIPLTIFYKKGKVIDKFAGYDAGQKETKLEAKIKEHYRSTSYVDKFLRYFRKK